MGGVEGRDVGGVLMEVDGGVVGSLGGVRTRVYRDSIVPGGWGSWFLRGELEGRLHPPRRLWWAAEKSVVLLALLLVVLVVLVGPGDVVLQLVVLRVGVGAAHAVDHLRVF